MNYPQDGMDYEIREDLPVMDLTTLSTDAIDYIAAREEHHKVSAAVKMSAIMSKTCTSMVGVICQAELEKRVTQYSLLNPAAARNLRELATANMFYIRDRIYDPKKGGDY